QRRAVRAVRGEARLGLRIGGERTERRARRLDRLPLRLGAERLAVLALRRLERRARCRRGALAAHGRAARVLRRVEIGQQRLQVRDAHPLGRRARDAALVRVGKAPAPHAERERERRGDRRRLRVEPDLAEQPHAGRPHAVTAEERHRAVEGGVVGVHRSCSDAHRRWVHEGFARRAVLPRGSARHPAHAIESADPT
ncbi:MAG: hypothetical protein ACK56I_17215, partial [bacterium]